MVAPRSPAETPARRATLAGAGPSIISINVEITGTISSPDELNIYGVVEGSVRAQTVTICEGGCVKGDVTAENVIVRGTVEGLINGQKVELFAGAIVRGDINHGALGIDTTATFEGTAKRTAKPEARIQRLSPKSKAAEAPANDDPNPIGSII